MLPPAAGGGGGARRSASRGSNDDVLRLVLPLVAGIGRYGNLPIVIGITLCADAQFAQSYTAADVDADLRVPAGRQPVPQHGGESQGEERRR